MNISEILTSKAFKLKRDEILFEPGTLPTCFYLITKGKIELIKVHSNGFTVEKRLEAGMTVGDIPFFSKTDLNYQAKVKEEATLIPIEESEIDLFIEAFPQFVLEMLKRLMLVLKEANAELEMAVGQTRNVDGMERKSSVNIVEVEKYYQIESKQKYPMLLPENHNEFLTLKEVECPVCDQKFSTNQIRTSKLVHLQTDRDLRRHYKNFDELWYQLWRCPRCGYTHFHNEFFKLTAKVKKELYECLPRKTRTVEQSLVKRDINQVIEEYYYFNKLIAVYNVDSVIKVRLWQSIAWLLEDVKDDEAAYKARRILKIMIEDSWFNSRVMTQPEDECKLTLKLSLLYKEEGNYKQARKCLLTLSQLKNIPLPIRNIIQDEILLLKELSKEEHENE